ncbi:MAG: putative rane protein [Polaromonas sp.]|jgi:uncharacterized membrane protein YbhN (UPF0104 family)|nr:putative rane protein [Polaromonas sp.]
MESASTKPVIAAVSPAQRMGATGTRGGGFASKPWWPWVKRLASMLFFALVITLLASQARTIEWDKVLDALEGYPLTAAWGAAALAVASLGLYSCFDLLSRRYTGHRLGTLQVITTTFVSYVFNLNLGSLVGGVALRYRLYSRQGLPTGVIARIVSFSMLTNWMGYLLVAGLVFSVMPPALPDNWKIDADQLRLIGFALVTVALGYLAVCLCFKRRSFDLRGHHIDLPSAKLAGLQLTMGAANWLLMSGIVYILLQHRIEPSAVISVLLLAAIAGVITHIPGNLGVLEAVFVALLSHKMPAHEIVASLVAYRVVYLLVPLAVAAALYLSIELRAKKLPPRR